MLVSWHFQRYLKEVFKLWQFFYLYGLPTFSINNGFLFLVPADAAGAPTFWFRPESGQRCDQRGGGSFPPLGTPPPLAKSGIWTRRLLLWFHKEITRGRALHGLLYIQAYYSKYAFEGDSGARAIRENLYVSVTSWAPFKKEGGVPRGGKPFLPPLGRFFAYFLDETRK